MVHSMVIDPEQLAPIPQIIYRTPQNRRRCFLLHHHISDNKTNIIIESNPTSLIVVIWKAISASSKNTRNGGGLIGRILFHGFSRADRYWLIGEVIETRSGSGALLTSNSPRTSILW